MDIPNGHSQDAFLGGRLTLLQPVNGLRAGSDAIFLAAALGAHPGQRCVEFGTGQGACALAYLWRVPDAHVTALEWDADLAMLARRNARLNRLDDRFRLLVGDARQPPLGAAAFDQAFANPPFFDPTHSRPSPHAVRARARHEGAAGDLAIWVAAMAHALRPGGWLTLIHRWERLASTQAALRDAGLGAVTVLPLAARAGQTPKRFLIRARRADAWSWDMRAPLILHGEGHGYRPEIEAILRHGQPLAW